MLMRSSDVLRQVGFARFSIDHIWMGTAPPAWVFQGFFHWPRKVGLLRAISGTALSVDFETPITPAAAGDTFLATTALLALGFALVRSAGFFAALPCATAGYVMTVRRGGDGRWVSLMITIGTLFSALTITAWMILLRYRSKKITPVLQYDNNAF